MVTIIFRDHHGSEETVDANIGETIMETAIRNSVPGIDADCGGACACATCHVYIEESALSKLPPADSMETAMLDFADHVQPNSRLSCQVTVASNLEGIVVVTPESQG
ncbi:MAG: 2Fe-2S iron-sulfur cluster-binding protein [Pseudomonadota bacterium]